jgi:hypothetical protein
MRVAIDPESISVGSYARLQAALSDTGKFVLVDRAAGFKAIAREQEIQHTTTRFGANEKYGLWGKMFGVGAVFVGTEQCRAAATILGRQYRDCVETLALVNATTGEVMAAGEVREDADFDVAPRWDRAVEKLVEAYPKVFVDRHNPNVTVDYSSALMEYRDATVPANQKPSQAMGPADSLGGK